MNKAKLIIPVVGIALTALGIYGVVSKNNDTANDVDVLDMMLVGGSDNPEPETPPIIVEKIVEVEEVVDKEKQLLAEDFFNRDYFTIGEVDSVVDVLNYELKKSGKLNLSNIFGKKDLIKKLLIKLEERPVVEDNISISDVEYSKDDYLFVRSAFFNKLKK